MKKLLFLTALLVVAPVALAQPKVVPTCNSFDLTGNPIYSTLGFPDTTAATPSCTDYFGVGNWANSPLPAGTIPATATPCVATPPATCTSAFTLVAGGSGYSTPIVEIADKTNPTGTCTATATVMAGVVTGFNAPTGTCTGYTIPVVTIVDMGPGWVSGPATCGLAPLPACGTGAMATANIVGPFTGGMPKFQAADTLPSAPVVTTTGITLPGGVTVAIPDTTTFPGSDYYEIGLVQYTQKLHSSLPPTTLRGYVQFKSGSTGCSAANYVNPPSYLDPSILAAKNRPVRVKFTNCLPTGAGGDLFIPTDTTYMGAGPNPIAPRSVPPSTVPLVDCSNPLNAAQCYQENRATLHLHGGATPWISDGTPHQWTVPVGETATYPKGDSVGYVPDMFFDATGKVTYVPPCSPTVTTNCFPNAVPVGLSNDPGQGSLPFFWTNQQGARLMFYHDHAYGITRLNVYVGEAAGYVLADPVEEDALQAATAPGTLGSLVGGLTAADPAHLIPLIIQDKTFVPSAAQLSAQDPTWAGNFGATPLSATGGNGDLWFTHVYIPNQNPSDPIGGANGFGHWDYGAWFFPPQTTMTSANPNTAVTIPCTSAAFPGQLLAPTPACPSCGCPITPNVSGTPEGFMDTPLVNGVAYPVLHVAPAAYRFKILSVGNDRSLNLSWFIADPTQALTEVAMLPAAPPPANGPTLPLCTAINPVAVPQLGLGLVSALLDNLGNPLNGTGLPLNCWPNYGPLAGIPAPQTMWAADGRAGGAPDPRRAGPPWIQIGSEGGLLPAPAVIPATPVNYEQNTRSITITNVAMHGLWLGPAERADVIVDFTNVPAMCAALAVSPCTLILYNDAPTPAPAFDSRQDYFTGDGDQTPIGGAPNTPAGYGPNTRTIMQVIVDQTAPNTVPFSLTTLKSAFMTTTVPPAAPNGLFAKTQPTTIVPEPAYNSAYNATFPATYMSISANNLAFSPIPSMLPLTFDNGQLPCTVAPCNPLLDQKAIQELFTLDYGRMNATLGVEIPMTTFLTQTTIPLGYVDWPTEFIQQGQTQLWKVTHNGVDTHFIHVHLFNVQVINRVGWDGSLRQVDPNELGWKDTVRMNPLEDILVALQPITPALPFPIPDSTRLNDVTLAAATNDPAISGLDPLSGNATVTTINNPVNFGWEYVWHCHILGHEENDMMRAIIFQVPPPVPTNLQAAAPTVQAPYVLLTWTDNAASETSFTVQRDTVPTFNSANLTKWIVDGTTPNTLGFSTPTWGQTITTQDTTATVNPPTTYFYQVLATDTYTPQNYNPVPFVASALSSIWSNIATVNAAPLTPTVTFTGAPASAPYNSTFVVTATTNSSSVPTIGAAGACTVGAVTGTAALATATVTMTAGTGLCTLTANWAADNFFLAATATQTTNATLAAPTVAFTGAPATAVYGTTFTVTATTNAAIAPTITGNAVCSAGTVVGTSPATSLITMTAGTGTCTVTASWAATANYLAASLTQNTTAQLATPVITWPAPAPIVYGTALSATQLNATAAYLGTPVAGTFVYNPVAGTVLAAGTRTLSVTFTPTLTANFTTATASVTLTVNQAPLTITALTTTMIYGGPVPPITPSYATFVNGDTPGTAFSVLPVCTTTATSTSNVPGPYPSTCSGAVSANYALTYVAGTVTVTQASTTTTITSATPNPAIRGQIVTFAFAVAPQFTGIPGGTVQVLASTGEICSGTLNSLGAGSCTITFLSGGKRNVTATYGGNGNFLGSTSAPVVETISSVDLSTYSLLFGNQILGTQSASQAVTLTNVGTSPLAISSITISGDFTQGNNCPVGGTLAPGSSCRVNVRFRPTALGVRTGTLTFTDVDPTSPQLVSLTGTGVQPIANLSPTTYNFGTIPRNTVSTFGFTLSNPGTAPLTINSISLFGSGRFSQTNNCGGTLAIGASCTITVRFSSASAGTFTTSLRVSDNAPGSPQTASISGTAQ